MKEQLQRRLQELRSEYEAGQKMLADLETQQTKLRQTLLRISGAMQVLEEVLADEGSEQDENGDRDSEEGESRAAP
jgi:predicted nuclease with TOPRIM domain